MDRCRILAARYDGMIARMGVDPARYRLRFLAEDDGSACVELLPGGGWLLRASARGGRRVATRFSDDDALLYRLVCDIARTEGGQFRAQGPRAGKDPRRADFAMRLELVGRVSPAWRIRLAEELALWLARHPYVDRT